MIRININGQDINEDFDRMEEDIAWQSITPPTISLELTKDQIKECKDYAYKLVLDRFPQLEDKSLRNNLSPLEKSEIVNSLSFLFEERQKQILNKQTKM